VASKNKGAIMEKILTQEQFDELIYKYYVERYGVRETDVWLESPATNVRTFLREGKYISLKSHILTGGIEEFIE
jgi:hypothetical protein